MIKIQLVFWSILLSVVVALMVVDGNVMGFIPVLLLVGSAVLITFSHHRRVSKLKKMDYKWYRSKYPSSLRNGQLTCHGCQSNQVHTRNLMNRTFMREHFCSQCGETLFYSPEGIRRS